MRTEQLSPRLGALAETIDARFAGQLERASAELNAGQLAYEIDASALLEVCQILRDDPAFRFEMLMDLAGVDRQREHVVGAGAHVSDAVVHERLRFARILRRDRRASKACPPNAFELAYIGRVDLVERRISLVVEIAAVRRPVIGRRRDQSADRSL